MPGQKPDPAADLTHSIFAVYNHAGPPERDGRTHDGKPVPPLERCGAVVRHKWRAASTAAARAGADVALRLIDAGMSPDQVRARMAEIYAAPTWPESGAAEPGSIGPAPTPGGGSVIGPNGEPA